MLTDIAILLKVGPYAGHWRLKEEYRRINLQASTSASGSGTAGKQEDEDEEMEEMEAVA